MNQGRSCPVSQRKACHCAFAMAVSDDLAAIVDAVRGADRATERSQIGHRACLPHNGVLVTRRGVTRARELSSVVDRRGPGRVPGKGAQIDHCSLPP
jgi:hypothetical protein